MASLVERPFAPIEVPLSARAKTAVDRPGFALSYGAPTADRSDLEIALAKLADQDSSVTYSSCATTGAFMIGGSDEIQLDNAILPLKRALAHEIDVGPPQVAYRERLSRRVEIDETYRKLTGGAVRFARVKIVFELNTLGAGSSFQTLSWSACISAVMT